MLWLVASALILVWLVAVVLHKGGFIHILLLTAIAICVVQFIANRRAMQ